MESLGIDKAKDGVETHSMGQTRVPSQEPVGLLDPLNLGEI